MLAHRRIHAQRHAGRAKHFAVDPFAHAVQALQLEGEASSHLQDRGNRAGVVGGELRIEVRCMAEQRSCTGQVGDVGVVLVGEHRVVRQPQLLRALDLAVPVGALDQPAHQPQLVFPGDARHFLHHIEGACLVGLHRQAEALPARVLGGDPLGKGLEHVERELQAIDFLGVDGEIQVGARRLLDQRPHARHQHFERTRSRCASS